MSENSEPTENVAKRDRTRLALAVGAALVVLVAGAMWFHFRDRVSTDDAQVDGHLVPVSCKVYGSVARVVAEDNQAVKAGDLLVELDARDLQAKVDQAKAALAQAEAAEVSARADTDKAVVSFDQGKGSDLQVAEANLDARKATLDKARADLERVRPLAERQEVSAQSFDAYKTAFEVADSECKAAQRRLASVRQESEIRRSNLGSQTAKVLQAKAGVEAAKANLDALKPSRSDRLRNRRKVRPAPREQNADANGRIFRSVFHDFPRRLKPASILQHLRHPSVPLRALKVMP